MRFSDPQIKIGINLYRNTISSEAVDLPGGGGKYNKSVLVQEIVGGKTLLFDSFIKKNSITVKPEYQSIVSNPNTPKKEQIGIDKSYDMQFEVLAEDKEQAIENYRKLLLMINHFYYLKVDRKNGIGYLSPNRFGNVGIIFKGNPPIFTSKINGFVGIDGIEPGYAKNYESVMIAENFSYDVDYEKGYILAPSNKLSGISGATKIREDKYETLIPISFTISINGTIPYDRYDTRVQKSNPPTMPLPDASSLVTPKELNESNINTEDLNISTISEQELAGILTIFLGINQTLNIDINKLNQIKEIIELSKGTSVADKISNSSDSIQRLILSNTTSGQLQNQSTPSTQAAPNQTEDTLGTYLESDGFKNDYSEY